MSSVISVGELAKARKLHGRVLFGGLQVSIENRKGSYRYWYDENNKERGKTLMHYPYGYVRGSIGPDGDHVDVYIGPNENATHVFVIDQMKAPDFKVFDEQKCMLGFDDADEAKAAYIKQYDDKRFFGSMKAMPFAEFARKVLSTTPRKPLVKGEQSNMVGPHSVIRPLPMPDVMLNLPVIEKSGPFIGPRGGKWADPKHTIPWKEEEHGARAKKVEAFDPRQRITSETIKAYRSQLRKLYKEYREFEHYDHDKVWEDIRHVGVPEEEAKAADKERKAKVLAEAEKLHKKFASVVRDLTHLSDKLMGPGFEHPAKATLWSSVSDVYGAAHSVFPTRYFSEDDPMGIDLYEMKRDHDKLLRRAQGKFRNALRALDTVIKDAQTPPTLMQQEKFSRDGFDFVIGERSGRMRDEMANDYLPHAREMRRKLESAGVGDAIKGMRIHLADKVDTEEGYLIAGSYQPKHDVLSVYMMGIAGDRDRSPGATTIHEIGHRVYFKLMSERDREAWERVYDGASRAVTDSDIDKYVATFEKAKRMVGDDEHGVTSMFYAMEKLGFGEERSISGEKKVTHADSMQAYLREKTPLPAMLHGKVWSADKLRDWLQNTTKDRETGTPKRVFDKHLTDYGRTNASEAFAEAFRLYVDQGPGALPDYWRSELKRAVAGTGMRLRKSEGPALLIKSPPPGGGWGPIPSGKKGGYRRMTGAGWEYYYPGEGFGGATPVKGKRAHKDEAHAHAHLTWKKTDKGYTAMDGRVKVEREGKVWMLRIDKQSYRLGKRATLDHAEGVIREHLRAHKAGRVLTIEELSKALEKAGPYIGPKGGKWADPQHTIPWTEEHEKRGGARTGAVKIDDEKVHSVVESLLHGNVEGEADKFGFGKQKIKEPIKTIQIAGNAEVVLIVGPKARGFSGSDSRTVITDPADPTYRKVSHQIFVKAPDTFRDLNMYKRGLRSVLAHEITHMADPSLARTDKPRLTARADEGFDKYINQASEVTARIGQIRRELLHPFPHSKVKRAKKKGEKLDPASWAMEHSTVYREAYPQLTPKNQKRVLRAVADMFTGVAEGTLDPVRKSNKMRGVGASIITIDELASLSKADKPSGKGWEPIPKGRRGGMRRKTAKGYDYWYPTSAKPEKKKGKPKLVAKPKKETPYDIKPQIWSEEELRAGKFDKDPSHWQWRTLEGKEEIVGWTAGGVDPDSAHPVKMAGKPHVLYQIEEKEAEPGWARLRNVNGTERVLIKHDRVFPVRHGPKTRVKQPEGPAPKSWPGGRGKGKKKGWKPGTFTGAEKKTPPYPESTAKKGTMLAKIEAGEYPLRETRHYEMDADGKPRRVNRTLMWMPDADKVKLIQEFAPLIRGSAIRTAGQFGLDKKNEALKADLQSAATEGLLHAIDDYPGGVSFKQHARFLSDQYCRKHAASEFAGGVALPRRFQRMLRGYIAARAEAARVYETATPSTEQVASLWRLKKRDVHTGLIEDRHQDLPMGAYKIRGPAGTKSVDKHPGKVEWAEYFEQFVTGQASAKGSDYIEEGIGLYDKESTPGAGLTSYEKVKVRHELDTALKPLVTYRMLHGKHLYQMDAAEILKRVLGMEGEPQSANKIAKDVPVLWSVKGELRPLAERAVRKMIPSIVERTLISLRSRFKTDETAGIVERAATRALPEPLPAKPSLTYRQQLQARAKAVTRDDVREWRAHQREVLKRAEQVALRDGNTERAEGARRLRERLKGIGMRRARILTAEWHLRREPASAEWFRSAEATVVERVPGTRGLYRTVATRTDPATGKQDRVKIDNAAQLRMSKADGETVRAPDMGVLQMVAHWPKLSKLLFGSDDILAMVTSLERDNLLEMVGLI